MPVDGVSVRELLFAQQDATPIPELSCPHTKLVAAVDLCQRMHAGKQRFSAPYARAGLRLE
ncbi:hypothetical protein D3C80_1404600 [compost metagenome]